MNTQHQENERMSRCHPTKCELAWMWPQWHPTPPHVPLYPTGWAREQQLVDGNFGSGVIPDGEDKRDYIYEEALGSFEIDWEKGYDVRDELGGDFKPKNQMGSYSCVAQAASQYMWVYQVLEMKNKYGQTLEELRRDHPSEVEEVSAKAIYSQIAIAKGVGSYLRDAALLGIKWGSLFEATVPSYRPNGMTDEDLMFDRTWKKPELDELARVLRGKEARVIYDSRNIDTFAQAIITNHGVLSGVEGSNGRGWGYAERPELPQPGDDIWGHGLYFGAFGKDEYGKYVAFPNSWGKIVKEEWKPGCKPGTGWQKIYVNYFEAGRVFNPWTHMDRPNDEVQVEGQFRYKFTRPMRYGQRSTDIKMLQQALQIDGCFPKDQSPTGYYGTITAQSVMEFHVKYKIVTIEELAKIGGLEVGPKTRKQLNLLFDK